MLRLTFIACIAHLTSSAFGHVQLLAPTGSDALVVGSTYEVSLEITVSHDTENLDLYYSIDTQKGPWIPIAIDLPLGDNSQNSIHTYDWVIPNMLSDIVWVRIVMDNVSGDYDDTNDQACSIIEASMCDGDINMDNSVSVVDLLQVIDQWGLADSTADVNSDGVVNISDLLMIVGNLGLCEG